MKTIKQWQCATPTAIILNGFEMYCLSSSSQPLFLFNITHQLHAIVLILKPVYKQYSLVFCKTKQMEGEQCVIKVSKCCEMRGVEMFLVLFCNCMYNCGSLRYVHVPVLVDGIRRVFFFLFQMILWFVHC